MNLLVLTPLVPYPPHDGDKLRLYHLLVELRKRGHRIDLFCLTRVRQDLRPAAELLGLCRRVHVERLTGHDLFFNTLGALMTGHPIHIFSYFSPRFRDALRAYSASPEGTRVDAVLAHRLRMAPYAFEHAPKRPVVLELTDSMGLMTGQLSRIPGLRGSRRLASVWDRGVLGEEELKWVSRSGSATLVSPVDALFLQEHGADPERLHVVANGVVREAGKDARSDAYPAKTPVVAFVGNMGYAPNEDGALWFLDRIWPLVKREIPDAVFAAVGGQPRSRLRDRVNGTDILVTGYVPAVEPYVRHATLTVAPLRAASGMQNKVALSLALGVPVVATPGAVSWLPEKVRGLVPRALDEQGFAQEVVSALRNPARARRSARKAGAYVRRTYRWDKAGAALDRILRQVVRIQPQDPMAPR